MTVNSEIALQQKPTHQMATSGKPVGPILKGRVSQKNIPSWDIIYDGKIGETGRLDLANPPHLKPDAINRVSPTLLSVLPCAL